MNKLYEVLEICLQDIEQGADIDTVLFRYPDLADELRPILEASRNVSRLAVPAPSAEVVQRNRFKVLQRAAQLRRAKARSARVWFASLRRVVVTLAVVVALFVGGTGLVRAASATVPGDQLYPVKRTWEDVLVLFTFNLQQRDALQVEHENERIQELQEVFAEKRSVEVKFRGLVTSQNGTDWVVAGIPVVVSAQTELRDPGIMVGSAVSVKGHTLGNVTVSADEIELLPPDATIPSVGEDRESEENNQQEIQDDSNKQPEGQTPKIEATRSSISDSKKGDHSGDSGSGDYKGSSDSGSQDNGGDSGGGDSGGGDD